MNDKDTELLPCPFCGNRAKIRYKTIGSNNAAYILCSGCKIKTESIIEDTDYCAVDEAIKLWNKRVDLNKLQQLLDDDSKEA